MTARRFSYCTLFAFLVLILAIAVLFSPTGVRSPLDAPALFAQEVKPLAQPPAG